MRWVFFVLIVWVCLPVAWACTAVMGTTADGVILIGNNEDYMPGFEDTVVRVRPATVDTHGCLLIGFDQQDFSMGGINDQGLFMDWFSVPRCGWRSFADREDFPSFRPENLLEACANVNEAIDFCLRYNLEIFRENRVFLVDQTGQTAVVEWGEEDLIAIPKEGDYQVVTNFFLAHPERGGYPCTRFNTATGMLNQGQQVTVDLFREILHAVSGPSTKYSNICLLPAGDMLVFNNHQYDEFIRFKIDEELDRGTLNYQIPGMMAQIALLAPFEGATTDETSIAFSWNGLDDREYRFCLSTDHDLSDCEGEAVQGLVFSRRFEIPPVGPMWLFGGLTFCAAVIFFRRRPIVRFGVLSMACLTMALSCDDGNDDNHQPTEASIARYSHRVDSLQPHTTYYWQITAESQDGVITKSVVRSFVTGE